MSDPVTAKATAAAYTASVGTVFLGLTSDQWSVVALVAGIVLGVLTFGVNVWFQWRRDQREVAASRGLT